MKPTHYQTESGYDIIALAAEYKITFAFGNFLKYAFRFGLKDEKEKEYKKMLHYLQATQNEGCACYAWHTFSSIKHIQLEEKLKILFAPVFERLLVGQDNSEVLAKTKEFAAIVAHLMRYNYIHDQSTAMNELVRFTSDNFKF